MRASPYQRHLIPESDLKQIRKRHEQALEDIFNENKAVWVTLYLAAHSKSENSFTKLPEVLVKSILLFLVPHTNVYEALHNKIPQQVVNLMTLAYSPSGLVRRLQRFQDALPENMRQVLSERDCRAHELALTPEVEKTSKCVIS